MAHVYSLYKYTHRETGRAYIGVTLNLGGRMRAHARGDSGAHLFNRAMKKYGPDAFDFQVLETFGDAGDAAKAEGAAILSHRTLSPDGYNLVAGAPGTPYGGPQSDDMRQRQGDRQRGQRRVPLSPEHKSACGESQKRTWSDPAIRERRLAGMARTANQPDKIQAASDRSKALWADPAMREKIQARMKGAMTPQGRERVRKATKERMADPEMKQKVLEALDKAMTPERRSECAKAGWAKLTPDERANRKKHLRRGKNGQR